MGFRANFMPACFCGEIYFYFIENQSDVNCHRTCVPMWTVYLDIGLSWFSLIPPADRFEYWATDVQHHGHFAIGLSGVAHGPLTRYVKLHVVHAPGMPGTFSLPPLEIANLRFPLKSVAGKMFPAFLAHVQPALLRIWQEAHGPKDRVLQLMDAVI